MTVTRTNIMTDEAARHAYIDGVLALKAELPAGATTTALGVPGPAQPLSTWDLFVLWHGRAMSIEGSTGHATIHQGPVFLPWHRWMLLLLEANMARVLNQPNFALPYWDWAADGARRPAQQPSSPLFGAGELGHGAGVPSATGVKAAAVPDGKFGSTTSFVVRVADGPSGPRSVNRPLQRRLGALT